MKEPIIQNRLNNDSLWVLNHKNIENNKIKIIVLGDSHLNSKGWNEELNKYELDINGKRYINILMHIVKNHGDALFVIHGGDTIGEGLILKDNEEKIENMRTFVNVTKEILIRNQIPIFITIGDSDYITDYDKLDAKLFLQYIGDESNKIDIQDTLLSLIMINPLFDSNSINYLKYNLQSNYDTCFLVDFHMPLKTKKLETLNNHHPSKEKENMLSLKETNKILEIVKQNVIGIFNHHIHLSHQFTINKIPYIITSCAGNKNSSNYDNYYVVEIDNIYSNPIISKITGISVL